MWFKLKVVLTLIRNPKIVKAVIFSLLFLVMLPWLIIVSVMSMFISIPLSPPSITNIYQEGIRMAEQLTRDAYPAPVRINPTNVLIVSAIIRKQDFSSASVRNVRSLARQFIEKMGYKEIRVHVGYEPIFNSEGEQVGQRRIYEIQSRPIFRIRSLEEVMERLNFSEDEKQWGLSLKGNNFVAPDGISTGALLNWWTEVRHIFTRGTEVMVTDVTTGRSFRMRRTGGRNHADSEPVSVSDSIAIFDIWGGWSWQRRPVIVHLNGQQIAASMNGMPHGFDTIRANGMQGHVCIHFRHSRTHVGNREDLEHQAMVLRANGSVFERVVAGNKIDFNPYLEPDTGNRVPEYEQKNSIEYGSDEIFPIPENDDSIVE